MSERYTVENFVGAVKNPTKFVWEARRIVEQTALLGTNYAFNHRHGPGIDVIAQDWDNLLLLDACRYDYFEEQSTIDGYLDAVVSKGGHSWEFMKGNFVDRELHDTVYVTANPHTEKLDDSVFHAVKPVYRDWDTDKETVLPEIVVERAIEAYKSYPDKRLIIHFMQPHMPYLGDTAAKLTNKFDLKGWDKYHGHDSISAEQTGQSIWEAVKESQITHDELRKAYQESLDIVLDHVQNLVNELDGRTVISADHGEMLGERAIKFGRRRYGHPHDIRTKELFKVPWLTIDGGDRRKVKSGPPEGFERLNQQKVNKRLVSLGYKPE